MTDTRLFRARARRAAADEPAVALLCGQLPLAILGALCGPASLRTVRDKGRRITLQFSHPSIGILELGVAANDDRAHRTIRELRADRGGYARVLALLSRIVELDGQPGRFRFEAVHQLTHGLREPQLNRSWLNAPVDDLLHLLAAVKLTWKAPPRAGGKPGKQASGFSGQLLTVEVVNHMARTVTIASDARALLAHYSLSVRPDAFSVLAPARGRGPAGPVLARLRLGALIAARWRSGRQRITMSDVLVRFSWVALDGSPGPTEIGEAERVGRTLRPRLREGLRAVEHELADPARYGAGLLEPVQLLNRAALRTMVLLGRPPAVPEPTSASEADDVVVSQPTLDQGRLRDVGHPGIFDAVATHSDQSSSDAPKSMVSDHDDLAESMAGDHDAPSESMGDSQEAGTRYTTVELRELSDGSVCLHLGAGVELLLPAAIAKAAGLTKSMGSRQDEPARSKAVNHKVEGSSPPRASNSKGGRQSPPTPDLVNDQQPAAIPTPESSSDDSDRARGARLPAALAPPPARTPPPRPPRRRGPPRSDSDEPDQRRTA